MPCEGKCVTAELGLLWVMFLVHLVLMLCSCHGSCCWPHLNQAVPQQGFSRKLTGRAEPILVRPVRVRPAENGQGRPHPYWCPEPILVQPARQTDPAAASEYEVPLGDPLASAPPPQFVTVQAAVIPGEIQMVQVPGQEELLAVIVPEGLTLGSSFKVEAPMPSLTNQGISEAVAAAASLSTAAPGPHRTACRRVRLARRPAEGQG